ncbi:MAG TPA: DUF192 domain-containing protein [Bacilli bacterium]|nr:DUF192 domain-containing protein [Bacilli bacterium]
MYLQINNKSYQVEEYNSFFKRLTGLMFKKKANNKIICFPKCNSIHTFFCFQNIDICMTDKNNKILYIYKNFEPWKIIFPKKNVYYTYEMPLGYANKLKINDTLKKTL